MLIVCLLFCLFVCFFRIEKTGKNIYNYRADLLVIGVEFQEVAVVALNQTRSDLRPSRIYSQTLS